MYKYVLAIVTVVLFIACENKYKYDPYDIEQDTIPGNDVSENAFEVSYKQTDPNLKTIHVKMNGTNSYDAIFDTGCSSMSISSLELIDLIKSGTIIKEDYVGDDIAKIADGSMIEIPIWNIREIAVVDNNGKEHTLRDVKASVQDNMAAQILIGSNVIDNLAKKSYTVDLNKKTIRFE